MLPSSLQINQQALLWNNEDSQNRPRRGRPMSERGLKGCFVAPSQYSSSWFHWNTPCATHLFQKPVELSNTCLTTYFSAFLLSLLQMSTRKGHSPPLLLQQGAIPHTSQGAHIGDLISERLKYNQLHFPNQSSTWWLVLPFKTVLN